jgi:hypothetical protein
VALFLANETRSLIAGEAAAPAIVEQVSQALAPLSDLGEALRLRTLHLGPQTILVTICWRFAGNPALEEVQAGLARIRSRVRAADARISDVLFEIASPQDPAAAAPDAVSSATAGSWAAGAVR